MEEKLVSYERVDINNPATIIHYGQEVKEKIVELFQSVVENAVDYEELTITPEMIVNIESFNNTLEKRDKETEKKQNSIVRKVKVFLKEKGVKNLDTDVKKTSYKEEFDAYIAKLEESKKTIESIKNASICDAKMRDELSKKLVPYIDLLQEVIEVGKEDKLKYEKEIEDDKKYLNDLKSNPLEYNEIKVSDLEKNIQFKEQLLNLFEQRINELEKNLVIYKENEAALKLQQTNEFQILLAAESYIVDVVTTLSTQAVMHVSNYNQKTRANSIKNMLDAGNYAIKKDAELLSQNTSLINDLSVNKGIYVDTVETLSNKLTESLSLYIQGREQRRIQTQIDSESIERINSTISNNVVDLDYLNSDLGLIETSSKSSNVKKLTYKKRK